MIKIIALDLDGTLLNSDHQISPKTLQTLKDVLAKDIQLMIATGKTPFSAVGVKKQLGIKTWGVYTQGLTVLDPNDQIEYERALPNEVSRRAIELLDSKAGSFDFVIYNRDGLYTIRPSSFDDFLKSHHEPEVIHSGTAENLLAHLPFQKILIQGQRPHLEKLSKDLKSTFGENAHFVFSLETVLEIVPAGSSKGDGVRRVLEHLNLDPSKVMAFGDGDNDVEFLRLAGTSVAMGNGTANTKAAADYVTLTNDQDGIVHALYHFGILD